MAKTLYDPLVEQRGIEKGIEKGKYQMVIQFLDIVDDETLVLKAGLPLEIIKQLRKEYGAVAH